MAESERGGLVGNLPTAVKLAAVGLLIHQLMRQRGGDAAPAGGAGGGLGDILGGLLGGGGIGRGGPAADASGGGLGGLLGGLAGMLGGLRQQGFGEEVDSWIATGPNRGIAPDRLGPAFDPDEVEAAARQAGTDRGTLLDVVSQVMPEMVDRMTPKGRLPQADEYGDAGAFDSLLGSLGLGGPGRR